ncbi:MAG: hypothetical protein RLZZ152_1992, partial [Pseudomonadota bacterium]
DGIASGDVVLMIQHIGTIASSPDARSFSFLIEWIYFYAADLVESDDIFCKICIWKGTNLCKDACYWQFDVGVRF